MNFFQIKAFCAVADCESFTDASEKLFVSVSSLSKTIKSLEDELDVVLFNRGRSRIIMTAAGSCFYQYAKAFLEQQDSLLQQISHYQEHRGNNLRIALTTSQRFFSLLDPIRNFQKENQSLMISIFEYEKDNILKKLDTNEVDLAISWDDEGHHVPRDEYDIYYFKSEQRVLLCNKNHPLAKRKMVRLEEVRSCPFVLPDNELQRSIYIDLCEKNGFQPKIAAYYSSITTQLDLVGQDFGLSFILETMAKTSANRNVSYVALDPPIYNYLAIIMKKDQANQMVKLFTDYYLQFMRKRYSEDSEGAE